METCTSCQNIYSSDWGRELSFACPKSSPIDLMAIVPFICVPFVWVRAKCRTKSFRCDSVRGREVSITLLINGSKHMWSILMAFWDAGTNEKTSFWPYFLLDSTWMESIISIAKCRFFFLLLVSLLRDFVAKFSHLLVALGIVRSTFQYFCVLIFICIERAEVGRL